MNRAVAIDDSLPNGAYLDENKLSTLESLTENLLRTGLTELFAASIFGRHCAKQVAHRLGILRPSEEE